MLFFTNNLIGHLKIFCSNFIIQKLSKRKIYSQPFFAITPFITLTKLIIKMNRHLNEIQFHFRIIQIWKNLLSNNHHFHSKAILKKYVNVFFTPAIPIAPAFQPIKPSKPSPPKFEEFSPAINPALNLFL
jgi:hypothetical protein